MTDLTTDLLSRLRRSESYDAQEAADLIEELTSRIGVMTSPTERCPQCADTKRTCANIIAGFEVERRARLKEVNK